MFAASLNPVRLPDAMRAILFLLLAACGSPPLRAEVISYREPLRVEWGSVTSDLFFGEKELTWFTRSKPTFATGELLLPAERNYLADKLETFCAGIADDGQQVWIVSAAAMEELRIQTEADPLPSFSVFSPTPIDDWSPGQPTSQPWTLTLTVDAPRGIKPPRPPLLEIVLMVEGVPAKTAWQVSPQLAATNAKVASYAALEASEVEVLRKAARWATIFLVPASFSDGDRPLSVTKLTDLDTYAVPLGFGVRALAEAAALFDARRTPGGENFKKLEARLSPGEPNAFPRSNWWFPEPSATRQEMPKFNTFTGMTGRLVDISYPPSGSEPYNALRVRSVRNEWVIKAGPFRAMTRVSAAVTGVSGKTKNYTVEELREQFADQPQVIDANLRNIEGLKERLNVSLDRVWRGPEGQRLQTARFFWLPEVRDFDAAVRLALADELYTTPVRGEIEPGGMRYSTLFKPATVKGKVGLAYDPDSGAGLTASIAGRGLLDPRDTLSLSAQTAERDISGHLEYRNPYHQTDARSREYTVSATLGRDDEFLLGSLSADPFIHRYAQAGAEHRWQWGPAAHRFTLALAAMWDAHELSQEGVTATQQDDGLSIRPRALWEKSISSWEFLATTTVELNPAVGWDEAFWRGDARAQAKYKWGGESHEAMYAILLADGGSGTDDRPAALLYRLGEGDRMPGLKPGEYSGSEFLHGRITFGVSVAHLLKGLFKKDGKPDPSAIPPAFNLMFAEAFAEAGHLSGIGQVLSSYGVALQTKSAGPDGAVGFRLGYAWSPDSTETKGRVFSALDWNF